MKATLTNYHQAPRKVRLVANLLKSKKVDEALVVLNFMPKRASAPVAKLINSALANALSDGKVDRTKLIIKGITVDKGLVFKRFRPAARGSAHPINKRTSHVKVELALKK